MITKIQIQATVGQPIEIEAPAGHDLPGTVTVSFDRGAVWLEVDCSDGAVAITGAELTGNELQLRVERSY